MLLILISNKKRGGQGHYVGRPSLLGNPFRLEREEDEREEDREQVIAQYEQWLCERLEAGAGPLLQALHLGGHVGLLGGGVAVW